MSTVKSKNLQIGTDGTASNNFTIYTPGTPDGTLRVGNGNAGAATDKVTITSAGNMTVTGSITANGSTLATQNSLGVRNLIINGDMRIAQRGTSVAGIGTGDAYYTIDRIKTGITAAGTWTQSQSTDVPTGQGFSYSSKSECTTADASLSSGSYLTWQYAIEGQNLQHLKYGTASAESLTLSFWVKSNKTGTYILEMRKTGTLTKQLSRSYTIDVANTWEKKTIVIDGDTADGIVNNNTLGMLILWWLGAGTNLTTGTQQTSWGTSVNINRAAGLTVNLADTVGNYINFTGVQLEVSSVSTDFEFVPYDMELARCQRYCVSYGGSTIYEPLGIGTETSGTNASIQLGLPVTMRGAISVTASNLGNIRVADGSAFSTVTGIFIDMYGQQQVMFNATVASGLAATRACRLIADNSLAPRIIFTSEL